LIRRHQPIPWWINAIAFGGAVISYNIGCRLARPAVHGLVQRPAEPAADSSPDHSQPIFRFLGILFRTPLQRAVLGDLEEEFAAMAQDHGESAARRWFWSNVMHSIGPVIGTAVERACFRVLGSGRIGR
jgi:hypothetical protein